MYIEEAKDYYQLTKAINENYVCLKNEEEA